MAEQTVKPPPVPFPVPAHRNSGRKWEPHEDEWLQRAFETGSIQTLAEMLGRSQQSVFQRARALGLSGEKSPRGISWTEAEIAYLLANYNKQPKVEIARALNKSTPFLYKKANELGLVKRYNTQYKGKKIRCMLVLDEEIVALARRLGKGNFSEGVRIALKRAEQSENG
ncbi:MAG: hypothetical protein LBQ75_09500 [Zoogloeaceae bacterium]|jgi:hypothetical protein|nr:hypothetical protein [Zoogloeaceae bacterium]